jgi:signal transduction histidine kinase
MRGRLGHGLENMRERTQALGGELSLRPADGGGTEVRVSIPRPINRAISSNG